jgi:hypothetical protein
MRKTFHPPVPDSLEGVNREVDVCKARGKQQPEAFRLRVAAWSQLAASSPDEHSAG